MRVEPSIHENDPLMPASWRIVTALLRSDAISQGDLRTQTGLSHPVVVQQVAQLRRAGLIHFGLPLSGMTGRPRIPISFNMDYRRLLAIELHHNGGTFQATNLCGRACADPHQLTRRRWTANGIRTALNDGIRACLATDGIPWAGIGIILPGQVAPDGITVTGIQDIPNWSPVALGDELTAEFGIPVRLANEAQALARQAWSERATDTRILMAVSLRHDTRVMMTLVINGFPPNGAVIPAGEIGHIAVADSSHTCTTCGSTCLQALLQVMHTGAVMRAEVMRALTAVMATLVTAINPDELVIQGDAAWSAADSDMMQSTLNAHTVPNASALRITCHPSRPTESLHGAVGLLTDSLLCLPHGALCQWVAKN